MLDLDTVYKKYTEVVYKYLYTLCRNENIAEELTQETFYQAMRSSQKYNGSCKVSTWLCQIAKHLWYQELERKSKKETLELKEDVVSNCVSIEDKILLQEDVFELYKLIHSLDSTSKEVFLLRTTGDLSFRTIGDIFNKNENWARVTYYRAKQKIMKGWENHEM